MTNLYKYQGDELTILKSEEVKKYYKITDEVILTDDSNVFEHWKEQVEQGACGDSFGFFVLSNRYGIQLSEEDIYTHSELMELYNGYKYLIIDGIVTSKDALFKYEYKSTCSYFHESIEMEIELVEEDLTFVFERYYDDYHAIQIWKDVHDKYYKVVVYNGSNIISDVIAIFDKERADEEMCEMSVWEHQDDCHALFYSYDEDDKVIYSL